MATFSNLLTAIITSYALLGTYTTRDAHITAYLADDPVTIWINRQHCFHVPAEFQADLAPARDLAYLHWKVDLLSSCDRLVGYKKR